MACKHPHPDDRRSAVTPAVSPGLEYWRSLDELAQTPEFRQWAHREFPAMAMELDRASDQGGFSRRRFLQLMSASLALAGLPLMGGCRREEARILAYQKKPPEMVPGKALYYATTLAVAGRPIGVLAETHEGRPTKLEGNPGHPTSFGALDAFSQAAILDLYDPDRSRFVLRNGQPARYDEDFLPVLDQLARDLPGQEQGKGLAILTGAYCSPALHLLRQQLAARLPNATFHVYDPLDEPALAGPWADVEAVYDLAPAKVIVSLDCDLLGLEDVGIQHRRLFGLGRKVRKPGDTMNRLYVVEPHLTVTGMSADHHLRLRASHVADYALLLAREVLGSSAPADLDAAIAARGSRLDVDPRWIKEVAADLLASRRHSLVVAGRRQTALVRECVRRINLALNNEGATVRYQRRRFAGATLAELAQRIRGGQVTTLLMLEGNPVYDAPADLDFAALLKSVPTSIQLSTLRNETSSLCTWHLPQAHALESWGDAVVGDTLSPAQPMIDPLFGGRNGLELLARLAGAKVVDPYEIVRESFAALTGQVNLESRWRQYLHEGKAQVGAPEAVASETLAQDLAKLAHDSPAAATAGVLEVVFSGDWSVYDGRFANNGWMQESPDPVSKLTWDNAALLSPNTARELGLKTGDVANIEVEGRKVDAAVMVLPGRADGSVCLPLGYGRTVAGSLGTLAGFDAYKLRTSRALGFAVGAKVTATGGKRALAATQDHWSIEQHELIDGVLRDRAIVREGTLDQFAHDPHFPSHMGVHVPHLTDISPSPLEEAKKNPANHQWGMAIDLTSCINCNACVLACQAENNVPIVGKDEVIRGREMQWLRMDRYFRGADPAGDVSVSSQPMLCQHCENAPCEPVCPVNATVHDEEGLNVMVYNRCVGTRYCSNNCPYKVRRYNYFDFNKGTIRAAGNEAMFDGNPEPDPTRGFSLPQFAQPKMQEVLKMQKNPDVTVRMRGVMEKCTFCVQRIERAKIDMKVDAGQTRADKVPDGAVATACQQTCPTEAIVFGDLSDPASRVSRMKAAGHNYAVLEHLNVRPRTTYLARLRNPNPAMPAPPGGPAPSGTHAQHAPAPSHAPVLEAH